MYVSQTNKNKSFLSRLYFSYKQHSLISGDATVITTDQNAGPNYKTTAGLLNT